VSQFKPAKLSAKALRDYLPKMPFNALLGVRLVKVHRDGVTIECSARPDLMNGAGVLHGGVTATLADAAAGIATNRALGGGRHITTVELKINYFRPVVAGRVRARCYLLRVGKTLSIGRVDMFDQQKNMVAAALVTYMILGERATR
jgi:acyl-CoA thioesterase